jgi:catechol 2,3-dioxygenase-like lactoylglutathione lyase family enzyme
MIDHLGIHVTDLDASKAFYTAALAPLGYGLLRDYSGFVGLGADQKPDFWLTQGQATTPGLHLAFAAKDRATVDAFYAAAIAAGAKDNGAPGLRPQYHPGYYGAFVIDLNGHNLEVVCHRPA